MAGVLHGGAIMVLADTLGAVCAFLNLPDGATTSTIESKTNFFRAVRGGAAHATTTPLHVGRTTIVVQTDVRDDDGKRVALVTQTQAVIGPELARATRSQMRWASVRPKSPSASVHQRPSRSRRRPTRRPHPLAGTWR